MSTGGDVWAVVRALERDLQAFSRDLVELKAHLAALSLPDDEPRIVCPDCGLSLKGGPGRLAEHRYVVHDGPDPDGDL